LRDSVRADNVPRTYVLQRASPSSESVLVEPEQLVDRR
jgi:hypothetical protein